MSNLPVVQDKGESGQDVMRRRMKEMGISERNATIWECLSHGMTTRETAKKLNLSMPTVSRAVKKTLEQVREYALQDTEDWRHRQLLILDRQIELAYEDSSMRPQPLTDENGEQIISPSGVPKWIISPMEAAKVRNMGANRMIRALDTQAKLLNLTVERHEVDVRQVSVSILRGDPELIEGL